MKKLLILISFCIFTSSLFAQTFSFKNQSTYTIEYRIWFDSNVLVSSTLKPSEHFEYTVPHNGNIMFQFKYVVDYDKFELDDNQFIGSTKLSNNWIQFVDYLEDCNYKNVYRIVRPRLKFKQA